MATLDSIDRNIIRCLRRDGRMTNSLLASEVGLSQSACLRRVQILEESGVIRGYTAIVGSSGGDERLVAIVRITLDRQTEEFLNRFEEAVRRHPEVQECYLMTGDADYILRVEAENAAAYEVIHKEILSRLPGVARIHSSFAIRTVLLSKAPVSRG
ncbi:Lrp/AsnC family transcriptional regulator [Brucella sp. ZJ1_1]|uniref:Leucine-responsive regulatory protein n=2 Tax=Brucella intermedia TaxID=94625 RepID=C4WG98_9HYPH|nr:Lrp/AsnC family transcriptional regulator [Brucella intermedia]EEQ96405.1 Leucine-responsive regulatory protein [Brucella intermedia LMG 3301]ELT47070.1 AsnC family transcriptional regulator [Brucella intermedia M86]MCB4917335.1 Lrp/AsnC family transcriptional regulator [Brucella intermedia]NKB95702.1 Lrp/AsnC family transcriptional regulator [Brucella intermedia]OOC65369.1 AsnC family transcriptional regulator [Brucella intermedia M86]